MNLDQNLITVAILLGILVLVELAVDVHALIAHRDERRLRRLFDIRRGIERANMHEWIRRTYGLDEYRLAERDYRPGRLERIAYKRTALGHATHRHPASRTAYPISHADARIGGDERD